MSIYMVTWKTATISGEDTQGSFFSEVDDNKTIDEWIDQRQCWVDYAESTSPNRKGGDVLITGAFKL
jgi:hypothetical protein